MNFLTISESLDQKEIEKLIQYLDQLIIRLRQIYPNHKTLFEAKAVFDNYIIPWNESYLHYGTSYNEEVTINQILELITVINKILDSQ